MSILSWMKGKPAYYFRVSASLGSAWHMSCDCWCNHNRSIVLCTEFFIYCWSAIFIIPLNPFLSITATQSVFYNPVQEFNRDLTIAIISTFSRLYAKEEAGEADSTRLGRSRRRKIRILSKKLLSATEDEKKNRVTSKLAEEEGISWRIKWTVGRNIRPLDIHFT